MGKNIEIREVISAMTNSVRQPNTLVNNFKYYPF